jgi:hypothetical protein
LVVVVAAGEFDAEVEEAPRAREIEIRDPDGSRDRVATPEDSSPALSFFLSLFAQVRGRGILRTSC